MENIIGNVCFFHRQSDDKWLWFIADDYGRSLCKSVIPFNTIDDARSNYDLNKDDLVSKMSIDPFKQFFK